MNGTAKTKTSLFIASILGLLLLCYWQALSGPFVLDDQINLSKSQISNLSLENLTQVAISNYSGPLGRPLSALSFAFNHYFFGSSSFSFKLINLILHCFNALLIFILCKNIIAANLRSSVHSNNHLALLISALWLIHPTHANTVLYAVQRMTLLAACFSLLAILTYIMGRKLIDKEQVKGFCIMAVGFILFGSLAILAKEIGALIPFYILALESIIFKWQTAKRCQNNLYRYHLAFSLLPIAAGMLYVFAKLPMYSQAFAMREFSLVQRLLSEVKALLFYIKITLVPLFSDFSLVHDDFPIVESLDLTTVLTIVVFLISLVLAYKWRKKFTIISFGIIWFFIAHSLEASIFPLDLVFEHRNYLASFGIILTTAFIFKTLSQKILIQTKRNLFTFISILIVCYFSATLYLYNQALSSEFDMVIHNISFHPNSARAHVQLANFFAKQHDTEQSLLHVKKAQKILKTDAAADLHYMILSCNDHNISKSLVSKTKYKLNHGIITAYTVSSLNNIIQHQKQCQNISQASVLALLHRAAANPKLYKNPKRHALTIRLLAQQYLLQGNHQQSIEYLEQAYKIYPRLNEVLLEKAQAQIFAGYISEAMITLARIKKQHPIFSKSSSQYAMLVDNVSSISDKSINHVGY